MRNFKSLLLGLVLGTSMAVGNVVKDSEGMYRSNTGNGPSVAEKVTNTTGGVAYTNGSTVNKDSEALYQHNSGVYTKKITVDFVPKPPPIIKTTVKTIYKQRIIYRYKNCATGGGGTTPTFKPRFRHRWSVSSGRWLSSGKTYLKYGFLFRVYDAPKFRIFISPSGQGLGWHVGGSGGIGFSDGSYLQWGSKWRGGKHGNRRSWYFVYGNY